MSIQTLYRNNLTINSMKALWFAKHSDYKNTIKTMITNFREGSEKEKSFE